MIRLFEPARAAVCEWCGSAHDPTRLCHSRPGLTRRSFLFLGAAAGIALAVPSILVASPTAQRPFSGPLTFCGAPIRYNRACPQNMIYFVAKNGIYVLDGVAS